MRAYIETSCDELGMQTEYKTQLVDKITLKSGGSFLWVQLAFAQLERTFSDDGIMSALDEIPTGMAHLYSKVLQAIHRNDQDTSLMKAILSWVVCATKNMKVSELQAALEYDLGKSIHDIERSVNGLCGQLVRIEKTGSVQLVHSTARDFLLDPNLKSAHAVRRTDSHKNLATVCLKYLCSDQMRPPRNPALMSELSHVKSPPFADYAVNAWSSHLVETVPEDDGIPSLVYDFFQTKNILTWFEYIARRKKNLSHITQTAGNLRNYLYQRSQHSILPNRQSAYIDQWTTDMLRIVAKFGSSLLLHPSSIYFIVPPLCPRNSIVRQQFGSSNRLTLVERTVE